MKSIIKEGGTSSFQLAVLKVAQSIHIQRLINRLPVELVQLLDQFQSYTQNTNKLGVYLL